MSDSQQAIERWRKHKSGGDPYAGQPCANPMLDDAVLIADLYLAEHAAPGDDGEAVMDRLRKAADKFLLEVDQGFVEFLSTSSEDAWSEVEAVLYEIAAEKAGDPPTSR